MMHFILTKLKEEKGVSAVYLSIFLLMFLITFYVVGLEYSRVSGIYHSVTTEIERAGNISVEYSMYDEARGYHLSRIDESLTQDLFDQYFTDRIGLTAGYEKMNDGRELYKLNFDTFDIDEDTARITMKGTIDIPIVFIENYISGPVSLPFNITTRNVNIED